MTNKTKAKRIWEAVLHDLYNRRGFDDWWDGIAPEVKNEILETMTTLIKIRLDTLE